MAVQAHDLWSLVLDQQYIDPTELAEAMQDQVLRNDLDYRSRLLIRDGLDALRRHWGAGRLEAWLRACPVGRQIEEIWRQDFEEVGFPSLTGRLMEPTRPETIRQFLRELSQHIQRPTRIYVGRSASLILGGYLSRRTEDVDIVDEVPADIRAQPKLLAQLVQRYGLKIGHFQSHYLPMGWEQRVHTQAPIGQLHVALVDRYDVFLSKLFSARTKDRDDLRAVAPQLDKDTLVRKLKDTTQSMLASAELRQRAEQNWYILYGESLPS
jgi:hypothetical protein